MLFGYIATSPKESNKRYNVIDVLNQQNKSCLDDLILAYEKGKDTGRFQTTDVALLLIMDKYISTVLKNGNVDFELSVKPTLLA